MKRKKFVTFLLFFCVTLIAHSTYCSNQDDQIAKVHQKVLQQYDKIKSDTNFYDHTVLQILFKDAIDVDASYLKRLKADISKLKKIIEKKKKQQQNFEIDAILSNQLLELYNFLKKYHLQVDVVAFHAQVKKDWADMMQAVDKAEDILPMLPSKRIFKPGIKGLKILIDKMNRLLQITDDYEYRLHADWTDLKLINYVLKIELIRLRNAAIFHPLYRGTPIKSSYPR